MRPNSWLLAALIAASGMGMTASLSHSQKASTQANAAGPRIHKGGRLGGLLPAHRTARYTRSVPTCAARQKRASIKARNVRRHKRHCGARS